MNKLPSKIEAKLNALARKRGVRFAEEVALEEENKRDIESWGASATGLTGEDHRHLLLKGSRSYTGVLRGAIMYDPVTDEAVIIKPRRGGVFVEVGPLLLRPTLEEYAKTAKGTKRKSFLLELAAVDHVVDTYSDSLGSAPASRWLVDLMKKSALREAKTGTVGSTYEELLPKDPKIVWRELEGVSIVQPWGAPARRNPQSCMNPRRQWVVL